VAQEQPDQMENPGPPLNALSSPYFFESVRSKKIVAAKAFKTVQCTMPAVTKMGDQTFQVEATCSGSSWEFRSDIRKL
jgi:hypothetical protein